MSGKRYSPEEIISKLREAEVFLAEGVKVGEVIRRLGVNKITYYRWRQEYGGMKVEQAKRLKDLEKENARLKRLLADAELDKAILKEAAEGLNGAPTPFNGRALAQTRVHRPRLWPARRLGTPGLSFVEAAPVIAVAQAEAG